MRNWTSGDMTMELTSEDYAAHSGCHSAVGVWERCGRTDGFGAVSDANARSSHGGGGGEPRPY